MRSVGSTTLIHQLLIVESPLWVKIDFSTTLGPSGAFERFWDRLFVFSNLVFLDFLEDGLVDRNKYRLVFCMFALMVLIMNPVRAIDLSNSLALVYDDGAGNTLPYRLFLPPGYDEPGADFPLVLFLHGAGEIGTDNLAQVSTHINGLIEVTRGDRHPAFLLAPQVQPGQGGWSALWSPTDLALAMELTLEVIDQIEQQYAVDTSRRIVTGLSMGGFGTWDVAAKRPEIFAAAVPMSGGGDPAQATSLRDVPLWNFHGRSDRVIDADLSREMIDAIEQAGGSPLYSEVIGGHGIWDRIYNDPDDELYSWMFDDVDPPLATLSYNPANGDVKIDADRAPGGVITSFNLISRNPAFFMPQPTMTVDGVVVQTDEFLAVASSRYLTYKGGGATDGFQGVIDFGPVLPAGLDSPALHKVFYSDWYSSPNTTLSRRVFRVLVVVPEPASVVIALVVAMGSLSHLGRKDPGGVCE